MSATAGIPLTTGVSLLAAAERWPERDAVIVDGERLTWATLRDRALERARALIGMGVKPGAHVGLLLPNCIEYVVLFCAIGLVGGRALTINARYRAQELAHVLDHADVELLIIGGQALPHSDFRAQLGQAVPSLALWDGSAPIEAPEAPRLRMIVSLADVRETRWPGEAALERAAATAADADVLVRTKQVKPDDIALMMFSSGTTARPKACLLAHGTLSRTGAALAERFRLTAHDRIWNPMPLFHMSTMLPLAAARASGAAWIGAMHFDAGAGLELIARERVTVTYASFPTMMSAIVSHPTFDATDKCSIRMVHCVGPPDLLQRYHAWFPQAYLMNAYGLTEAAGVAFYSDPADPQDISIATNGRPFAGIEARIVDWETGAVQPLGAAGEIQLRGTCTFSGYYRDPDATARVLLPDGWLRTGDMGTLDAEGRLTYRGRFKDMLKIGGENVAALEIESLLCTHPDVLVAQVIGVPDDHLLEVAAAFVELRPGAELSPLDLATFCIGRIASFKIPRYVRIVRAWPMSATKIQKFKLQEEFEPAGKLDIKAMVAAARATAATRT